MEHAQQVMIIPIDSFNMLMEKVSAVELIVKDLKRINNQAQKIDDDPLNEKGYYYGDEIRRKIGWAKSTWTNGSKSHMIVDDRMILEPDPNNARRYRCPRADLHRWLQINKTERYNELFTNKQD